jgi:hypothetical protein
VSEHKLRVTDGHLQIFEQSGRRMAHRMNCYFGQIRFLGKYTEGPFEIVRLHGVSCLACDNQIFFIERDTCSVTFIYAGL